MSAVALFLVAFKGGGFLWPSFDLYLHTFASLILNPNLRRALTMTLTQLGLYPLRLTLTLTPPLTLS